MPCYAAVTHASRKVRNVALKMNNSNIPVIHLASTCQYGRGLGDSLVLMLPSPFPTL